MVEIEMACDRCNRAIGPDPVAIGTEWLCRSCYQSWLVRRALRRLTVAARRIAYSTIAVDDDGPWAELRAAITQAEEAIRC